MEDNTPNPSNFDGPAQPFFNIDDVIIVAYVQFALMFILYDYQGHLALLNVTFLVDHPTLFSRYRAKYPQNGYFHKIGKIWL